MYRALIVKELREIWWMGAVAFALLAVQLWDAVGLEFDLEHFNIVWETSSSGRIPFLQMEFQQQVFLVTFCLAPVVAFWQTFGESFRGTWPFLLHRPLKRSDILVTKIAAGLSVTFISTMIPLLLYAWWAASPGMHASPFAWWMTRDTWCLWLASVPLYLAVFLCGIREARWFGSRFWPMIPVWMLMLPIDKTLQVPVPLLTALALTSVLLCLSIFDSQKHRDYA